MLAVVLALLVLLTAAAGLGMVITSLFWLTVVAFGGLLLTGAVGVGVLGARGAAADAAPPAQGRAHLRLAGGRQVPANLSAQGGGEVRRAA